MFKPGDKVYYLRYNQQKAYRTVERVGSNGNLWFAETGFWMPANKCFLVDGSCARGAIPYPSNRSVYGT